jgi:hypothetical protein
MRRKRSFRAIRTDNVNMRACQIFSRPFQPLQQSTPLKMKWIWLQFFSHNTIQICTKIESPMTMMSRLFFNHVGVAFPCCYGRSQCPVLCLSKLPTQSKPARLHSRTSSTYSSAVHLGHRKRVSQLRTTGTRTKNSSIRHLTEGL